MIEKLGPWPAPVSPPNEATIIKDRVAARVRVLAVSKHGLRAVGHTSLRVGDQVDVALGAGTVRGGVRWLQGDRLEVEFSSATPATRAVRAAAHERPREPRRPSSAYAVAQHGGVQVAARVLNFSPNGMMIEAAFPLVVGRLVALRIEGLPVVLAEVRWRTAGRLGLRLKDRLGENQLSTLAGL